MKLSKNKRDALRENADDERIFCGADIRLLLDALDEAEAENDRLLAMVKKCVAGSVAFHHKPGSKWSLLLDPIAEAAEALGITPRLE